MHIFSPPPSATTMAPTFPGKFESGLRRLISMVGWFTPVGDARRVAQRRWKEALISRCPLVTKILGINGYKKRIIFGLFAQMRA